MNSSAGTPETRKSQQQTSTMPSQSGSSDSWCEFSHLRRWILSTGCAQDIHLYYDVECLCAGRVELLYQATLHHLDIMNSFKIGRPAKGDLCALEEDILPSSLR
jgi:hypothetical protein